MDIICIGEALIDFFAVKTGCNLRNVTEFKRIAGGAPANVAVGAARLGAEAAFIGRVGLDEFGFYLRDILRDNNVNIEMMQFDKDTRTGLAFISLPTPTSRGFLFYRNPSADMLLDWKEFNYKLIEETKIFHFGSISLIEQKSRKSTIKAVEAAKKGKAIISYDPNLRIELWQDVKSAEKIIKEAMPLADIIKLNDVELEFITGNSDIKTGAKSLLQYGAKLCLVTLGEKGSFYCSKFFSGFVPTFNVKTIDSTGCGDSFVSSFLSYLIGEDLENLAKNEKELMHAVKFATAAASLTSMKKGVISALPYKSGVDEFLKESSTIQ